MIKEKRLGLALCTGGLENKRPVASKSFVAILLCLLRQLIQRVLLDHMLGVSGQSVYTFFRGRVTQWLKTSQRTMSLAGSKLRAHPEKAEVKEQMEEIQNKWRKKIPQNGISHCR